MLSIFIKGIYYIIVIFPFVAFSFLPLIYPHYGILGLLAAIGIIISIDLLLQFILLKAVKKLLNQEPIEISGMETNDEALLKALVSYLFPFLTFLLKAQDNIVFIIMCIDVILCGLLSLFNTIIISPFLILLGYHCYKISVKNGIGGCVLITKERIKNPKNVLFATEFFPYIYLR